MLATSGETLLLRRVLYIFCLPLIAICDLEGNYCPTEPGLDKTCLVNLKILG